MENSQKSKPQKHNHAVVVCGLINRKQYHPYPLEPDDRIDIDNMYGTHIKSIKDKLGEELSFRALYDYYLEPERVVITTEHNKKRETISLHDYEEMRKQLNNDFPASFKNWEESENGFSHSYIVCGEYCSDLKRVILYVDNIKLICQNPKEWKAVRNQTLKTYVHVLFHAYFHFVTEQSLQRNSDVIIDRKGALGNRKYNYIFEIEAALAELCTLAQLFQKNFF